MSMTDERRAAMWADAWERGNQTPTFAIMVPGFRSAANLPAHSARSEDESR
jgi:hypothetical protein